MARRDFRSYYLERVAIGEACGCAEAVIRIRDLDGSRVESGGRKADSAGRSGRRMHRLWIAIRAGLQRVTLRL